MTLRLANGRRLLEWINVGLVWVVLYWMTWCTLLEAPMELTLRLWNDTILTQTLGRWLLLWARQGLFSNSLIIEVSGLFDEQFLVFVWQCLFFFLGKVTPQSWKSVSYNIKHLEMCGNILCYALCLYTWWNTVSHVVYNNFELIYGWRYINSQRWRLGIVFFFQIVEPQSSLHYRTHFWVDP